jgi:hypothetical protein
VPTPALSASLASEEEAGKDGNPPPHLLLSVTVAAENRSVAEVFAESEAGPVVESEGDAADSGLSTTKVIVADDAADTTTAKTTETGIKDEERKAAKPATGVEAATQPDNALLPLAPANAVVNAEAVQPVAATDTLSSSSSGGSNSTASSSCKSMTSDPFSPNATAMASGFGAPLRSSVHPALRSDGAGRSAGNAYRKAAEFSTCCRPHRAATPEAAAATTSVRVMAVRMVEQRCCLHRVRR